MKKCLLLAFFLPMMVLSLLASSHREAPLIADDPTADNVDLYAFRSPNNPNTITLIATYIPMQLPHGGPNYYNFDPSVRYEIHVDNDVNTPGDDITYRFTFTQVNEDPTTFFNIRLGKQNLKTTYKLEKITATGTEVIVVNGIVPPNNIGTRSITGGAGLNTSYNALFKGAITTATTGAKVYAGPSDDPFFVDLGGIFDLGDAPRQNGMSRDDLACMNVHALAIQVPIANLLKKGAPSQPRNILDSDYVIGVWASASRPKMTVFSATRNPTHSGEYVQVSRLGMPLTNEAVIPIGQKDFWNAISPYEEISETTLDEYFYNPELALYMDDDQFGGAVPSFAPLRVQTKSLGVFDFSNGGDGLFALKGSDAVKGTALDDAVFGTLLLPAAGKPRSVDLWPAFHTGVPNVIPYQLATGKNGNPLAAGKPFVNNFLPNGGDMLRLNMAVPVTPRNDPNFSSLGLVQAAAIGLTVAPFNTRSDLEFIPNMDGFPNGRRLEDDVTRIELQAVSGVVLAAIGLWYDDFDGENPVSQDLLDVLTYTTGVEENDKSFSNAFPYLAQPHSGTGECSGTIVKTIAPPPPPPPSPPAVTCTTPTNIQVELRNPKLTRISWDKTAEADRYILQIRFKGMNRWLITARVRGNRVFVHAPANKTYEFRIAAVCDGRVSDYSSIIEYTTAADLDDGTIAQSRSRETNDGESIFIENTELTVFPNPVTDNLTVQYKATNKGTMALYHISGVKVRTLPLQTNNSFYNLNMSDLNDGYYLLKIEEDSALPVTKRVVKTAIR